MRFWHKLIWGLFGLVLVVFLLLPTLLRGAPRQFLTNLTNQTASSAEADLTDLSLFEIINDKLMNLVARSYNFISPSSRLFYFPAGLRKEEIIAKLDQNLNLEAIDLNHLKEPVSLAGVKLNDGFIRPGFYLFNPPFSGTKILADFKKRFTAEVINHYPKDTATVVSLKESLVIASLIEREASGSHDMPLISGIIWNRLNNKMPLGLDASLQYIYGTSSNWWPRVLSSNKEANSPYNTYTNLGLPPEPISNPSDQSIMAALNPTKTKCLYYLHDKNRKIHCSQTYEEHKQLIKKYY